MRLAKLCLANLNVRSESGIGMQSGVREAKQSFAGTHSQAELGNDRTTEGGDGDESAPVGG